MESRLLHQRDLLLKALVLITENSDTEEEKVFREAGREKSSRRNEMAGKGWSNLNVYEI